MAMQPIGRFAPSPTHHLHLGSLTTAVASFCHIKSLGGKWLVRIEDIDFERCKPKYTDSILYDLETLGLHWDDQVWHQSTRRNVYNEFLYDQLSSISYACHCSRKELQAHRATRPAPQSLNTPIIYPRLCLNKRLDKSHLKSKIRLQLPNVSTAFFDELQGVIWDNPALSLGDIIVKRQNQMINYVLACAIDDGLQNISHIMRGLDIMPMTVAQIHILKQCRLPVPNYFAHLPLLINANGQKLSKQNLATPIDITKPTDLLIKALKLLGQTTDKSLIDATPEQVLAFAVANWDQAPLINKTVLATIS